jgi:large subunit ribosomal protein L5|tara:strand:+ start:817 stop:1326 length:510 start_codon:yes stop_codon:yes gene_type:complete
MMKDLRLEKVTLNFGAGKEQSRLEKGEAIIKAITGKAPQRCITEKRIPTWGVRPGLPIGAKLTLRKKEALALLKRLLVAKENKLKPSYFDKNGNISFGIPEYIDIPDTKYDPKIGVLGLQVCITLERPGFRIKRRRLRQTKIGKKHVISKEEAQKYMTESFKISVEEEA